MKLTKPSDPRKPQSLKSVFDEVREFLDTERTDLTAAESVKRNHELQAKLREVRDSPELLRHWHD